MTDRNDKLKTDRPVAKEEKKKAAGTGAVVGGVAGGVAGGAAAGAAVGGMTGPVGAAVGAVAGAVIGAVAGRSMKADPKAEDKYWRENYTSRPYVSDGSKYEDYGPAYSHGVNAYTRSPDRQFDEMEPELRTDWSNTRGNSSLEWDHAKHASRDAWQRVKDAGERALPGDADGDGR
jgi:hypothetical protein